MILRWVWRLINHSYWKQDESLKSFILFFVVLFFSFICLFIHSFILERKSPSTPAWNSSTVVYLIHHYHKSFFYFLLLVKRKARDRENGKKLLICDEIKACVNLHRITKYNRISSNIPFTHTHTNTYTCMFAIYTKEYILEDYIEDKVPFFCLFLVITMK